MNRKKTAKISLILPREEKKRKEDRTVEREDNEKAKLNNNIKVHK